MQKHKLVLLLGSIALFLSAILSTVALFCAYYQVELYLIVGSIGLGFGILSLVMLIWSKVLLSREILKKP